MRSVCQIRLHYASRHDTSIWNIYCALQLSTEQQFDYGCHSCSVRAVSTRSTRQWRLIGRATLFSYHYIFWYIRFLTAKPSPIGVGTRKMSIGQSWAFIKYKPKPFIISSIEQQSKHRQFFFLYLTYFFYYSSFP